MRNGLGQDIGVCFGSGAAQTKSLSDRHGAIAESDARSGFDSHAQFVSGSSALRSALLAADLRRFRLFCAEQHVVRLRGQRALQMAANHDNLRTFVR